MLCNKRSHHKRSPCTATRVAPIHHRGSHWQQQRPSTAQIKFKKRERERECSWGFHNHPNRKQTKYPVDNWIDKFWYIIPCCLASKSRLTFCNPLDCSPPGSSDHRISQARILERAAISFSGGSSRLRDQTCVFCIGRQILYHWATREVPNFGMDMQQNSIEK